VLELAASIGRGERFRCVPATPANDEALERLLERLQPRVLLIDALLVARIGADALRRVHRRQPATSWVLLWGEPSTAAFEFAVRAHMSGCLEWRADDEHVARALQAVLRGEVWFPRGIMQSLYLSLLAATQTHGTSAPMPLDAGAQTPQASGEELTARELQVMALMRQGLSNKQIAERLDISVNTVKKHLAHAFEKRGLHNRRQALG
jgi:DNA-binding NarL/FixJ family response regulator